MAAARSWTNRLLWAGVALFALAIVALFALARLIDVNSYRPAVESRASAALGMNTIVGEMRLSFFPLGVEVDDIRMESGGKEAASVGRLTVGVEALPLLTRKVRLSSLELERPMFSLWRDRSGKVFPALPKKTPAAPPGRWAFSGPIGRAVISDGSFSHLDMSTGRRVELSGVNADLRGIAFGDGGGDALAFEGDASVGSLAASGVTVSDISFHAKVSGGRAELAPLKFGAFGGLGEGSLTAGLSGKPMPFALKLALRGFRAEDMLGAFSKAESLAGRMDLRADLSFAGTDANGIKKTASGEVALWGRDMGVPFDADRFIEKYEKSQNINLVDVGAYFVVGPFGPLLTKGYNFTSLYPAAGGKGVLRELSFDWRVGGGVAEAQDVAFSTRRARVAVRGGVDLARSEFRHFTVAVLDEKGCAKYSQALEGSVGSPRVEKTGVLTGILGPVLSLSRKAEALLRGGKCEVFYSGKVRHPGGEGG